MTAPATRIVVADANVLINLMHVSRLGLCAELPGLEFMIPDHVRQEIQRPEQSAQLDEAMETGVLQPVSVTDPADIRLFASLITRLGRGEAACLVLATRHGWTVASDEKGRFRREAVRRIGKGRLIGTVDLYVRAIHASLLTVEEADAEKAILEGKRFKMPFGSFHDRIAWEE